MQGGDSACGTPYLALLDEACTDHCGAETNIRLALAPGRLGARSCRGIAFLMTLLACPKAVGRDRPQLADRRRPTFGTARRKPAGQDMILNVAKVALISPTGAPGIGHCPTLTPARSMAA